MQQGKSDRPKLSRPDRQTRLLSGGRNENRGQNWSAEKGRRASKVCDSRVASYVAKAGKNDHDIEAVKMPANCNAQGTALKDRQKEFRPSSSSASHIRDRPPPIQELPQWHQGLVQAQGVLDDKDVPLLIDKRYDKELKDVQDLRGRDLAGAAQRCRDARKLANEKGFAVRENIDKGFTQIIQDHSRNELRQFVPIVAKLGNGVQYEQCVQTLRTLQTELPKDPELAELQAVVASFNPDSQAARGSWPEIKRLLTPSAALNRELVCKAAVELTKSEAAPRRRC